MYAVVITDNFILLQLFAVNVNNVLRKVLTMRGMNQLLLEVQTTITRNIDLMLLASLLLARIVQTTLAGTARSDTVTHLFSSTKPMTTQFLPCCVVQIIFQ